MINASFLILGEAGNQYLLESVETEVRSELLMLAVWTVVRPTACHHEPADGHFAHQAGQTGSHIHAMLQLEEAADAGGVDIVRYRGAA